MSNDLTSVKILNTNQSIIKDPVNIMVYSWIFNSWLILCMFMLCSRNVSSSVEMLNCIYIWYYIDNKDILMKRIWISQGTSGWNISTSQQYRNGYSGDKILIMNKVVRENIYF